MALAGHITVTPEQLKSQSNAVKTELAQMQERFEQMKQLVNGMEGYWTGEAAQAHRNNYLSKQGRIEEMFRRYQEHIKDLEIMAGVYETAEAEAVKATDELPPSVLD